MSAYRNRMLRLLPRWASSAPGSKLWACWTAIGDEFDRLAFFHRWSFLSRLISACHVGMLSTHGILRKIPRYSLDNDSTYRTRLLNAWVFYRALGTSKSIVMSFGWLGYTAEVICEKDWTPETKPDSIEMWNRFWVRVWGFPVDAWNQPDKIWNEPAENWNAPNIGLAEFRKLVLRCRFSGNLFVGFIFVQDDGSEVFVTYNDE